MTDEPKSKSSNADLWWVALLIAVFGSYAGHWYADDNTGFLSNRPWVVAGYIPLVGLPFFALALGAVRSWWAWALLGGISLVFWGFVFSFARGFTT